MKYYGERTKKLYDSVEACEKAEFAAKEQENLAKIKVEREKAEKERLAAERKSRAAKIEELRKAMVSAQHQYREAIEQFTKDYGSYHYTSHSVDDIPTLFDFFGWF